MTIHSVSPPTMSILQNSPLCEAEQKGLGVEWNIAEQGKESNFQKTKRKKKQGLSLSLTGHLNLDKVTKLRNLQYFERIT